MRPVVRMVTSVRTDIAKTGSSPSTERHCEPTWQEAPAMSSSLERFFEGFATPAVAHDECLAAELAVSHAQQMIKRFVKARQPDLESVGLTVPAAVLAAVAEPPAFDDVWCLPIGIAWVTLRSDSQYPTAQVAPLIARWATCLRAANGGRASKQQDAAEPSVTHAGHRIRLRYQEDLRSDFEKPL